MNPADVAVIIACKARVHHLRQSLPRWQACDPAPGQVIVVDYGCPDGAANYVAQHFPRHVGGPGAPRYRSVPRGKSS